tara:strand:- start:2633 stop:3022 length:390 start_codon:yes stop_codon:yes gene_type:complete
MESEESASYSYVVTSSRNRQWQVELRAIPTEGGVLITKDCVDPHHPDGFERIALGGIAFVPSVESEQDAIIRDVNEMVKEMVSSAPVAVDIQPDLGSMTLKELKAYAKEKGVFVGNKKRARLIKDLSNL